MNQAQREAIDLAISHEEDWLDRAHVECRRRGTNPEADRQIAWHERRLAELKEGL